MRKTLLSKLVIVHVGVLLVSPILAQITVGNPVTIDSATVSADSPEGIAFHPVTNSLFVICCDSQLVQLDLSGNLINTKQLLIFGSGIAYDPISGDLLVSHGSRVFQVGTDGTLVSTLLDLAGIVEDAKGVAVHPISGNLWIADDNLERIFELDRMGVVQSSIPTLGVSPGFSEPEGISFLGNDLLVVDDGDATQSLYLLSTAGELLQVVVATGTFGLGDPEGVTAVSGSTIWIASDNDGQLLSLDITGGFSPEKLYFAQFGNGSVSGITLRSDIVLPNPSTTETASGTVNFSKDDGSPFVTDVEGEGNTSNVDFTVSPLGSTTISTTGQGEFNTGTAVVSSSIPLAGVIRFDINAPAESGIGSGIAGVPASQVVSGFITPVQRVAGGINTGVAIRNVGTEEVSLTLSLREGGLEVPSGSVPATIPGNGQVVAFIDGLFPDADTDNFVGSLVVTSDGMIAATALEQGTQPGEFTTLPVTPLQ